MLDKHSGKFFTHTPIGPLGIISVDGRSDLVNRVNEYLLKWRNANDESTEGVSTYTGYKEDTFFIDIKCPRFANGEGKGVILDSVRGLDLFIICDVGNYATTYKMYGQDVPMSPDEHFQDLKRIIGAASSTAKRITVVMPMLYESRQHRRIVRESLDSALALQELQAMGVKNIITFDAHDPKIQNAVPLMNFESVHPTYQMIKALFKNERDLKIDKEHLMTVSPDEGAVSRNIYYSSVFKVDVGMFYKRRDYAVVKNGKNPIVAHEYVGSSVEGKDIIVADDMIASGGSMLDVCRELKARKARNIYILATFGLFTEGLDIFNKAYEEGLFKRIYTTNFTYQKPELFNCPWYRSVDGSKYLAYLIATMNHDYSLAGLVTPYSKITKALEKYKKETGQE